MAAASRESSRKGGGEGVPLLSRRAVSVCCLAAAVRVASFAGGVTYIPSPLDIIVVPQSYSWDVAVEIAYRTRK
jgi:hypothetical protein